MANQEFFDSRKDQSLIKTLIVTKYFEAWAKVMLSTTQENIHYLDLFAGPGQYADGSPSTPLIVLQKALQNPKMTKRLVTVFNDSEQDYADSLEEAISNMPGIEKLAHKPEVFCSEVDASIVNMLAKMNLVPTFFFADPFGYKGLSLELLKAGMKDFGSDCVFFFNYNRVNMGVSNELVKSRMEDLFGEDRAAQIGNACKGLSPSERELLIVEELCNAIRDTIKSTQSGNGRPYILPFCFKNEKGTRTSHHLIFISKHIRGYEIMKDIMARESSTHEQGVASFEYNVATVQQPFLFEFFRPLNDLEDMLCITFAGQEMTMEQIYDAHHVDRCYVKRNYKDALINLEAANRIVADPPSTKRRPYKGEPSFGPNVQVTFPQK